LFHCPLAHTYASEHQMSITSAHYNTHIATGKFRYLHPEGPIANYRKLKPAREN
jgi:hypothetical protein